MKKLEKELSLLEAKLKDVQFERKDTSYRRILPEHEALLRECLRIRELIRIKEQRKYERECIAYARSIVERDIKSGTINTSYGKVFIQGHRNIYYAHPYFGHEDYNKARLMPNTPKHWRVAQELNKMIETAKTK